jgi:trigger factor
VLNLTFPEDYNAAYLAGKAATFEVTATKIQTPKEAVADEDFAKSLGLESLEQLRGLLKGQVEQELNGLTRTHMKRKLLDQLASAHDFPVPPSMVEAEFEQIWRQLEQEAAQEADPRRRACRAGRRPRGLSPDRRAARAAWAAAVRDRAAQRRRGQRRRR